MTPSRLIYAFRLRADRRRKFHPPPCADFPSHLCLQQSIKVLGQTDLTAALIAQVKTFYESQNFPNGSHNRPTGKIKNSTSRKAPNSTKPKMAFLPLYHHRIGSGVMLSIIFWTACGQKASSAPTKEPTTWTNSTDICSL